MSLRICFRVARTTTGKPGGEWTLPASPPLRSAASDHASLSGRVRSHQQGPGVSPARLRPRPKHRERAGGGRTSPLASSPQRLPPESCNNCDNVEIWILNVLGASGKHEVWAPYSVNLTTGGAGGGPGPRMCSQARPCQDHARVPGRQRGRFNPLRSHLTDDKTEAQREVSA